MDADVDGAADGVDGGGMDVPEPADGDAGSADGDGGRDPDMSSLVHLRPDLVLDSTL